MTPAQALAAAMAPRRRHKYNARATIVDGIKFPTEGEANRWCELRMLQIAGDITELKRQVRFALVVKGVRDKHVCDYIADFTYRDRAGRLHVEDFKGVRTAEYKLKRALMLACHGVEIEEIGQERKSKRRRVGKPGGALQDTVLSRSKAKQRKARNTMTEFAPIGKPS